MRGAGQERARQAARRMLDGFGVREPEDIRVRAIAWALGAEVVEGELEGAVARLIRVGKRSRIRLSDKVEHPGARRFSIAHELGHLVLDHPATPFAALCKSDAFMAGAKEAEAEANAFAAELLMPEFLVRPLCALTEPDLRRAQSIASGFRTSILASAIRLVELAEEPCAVVFSQEGDITWAARTDGLQVPPQRGQVVGEGALARACAELGQAAAGPAVVPMSAWIPRAQAGTTLIEHSMWIAGLDAVLTILRLPPPSEGALRS